MNDYQEALAETAFDAPVDRVPMPPAPVEAALTTVPGTAVAMAQAEGRGWVAYHGDCVDIMPAIPSASVDFSIFSPPFASLYTYSASDRDMGNCRTHGEFYEHFRFLVPELFRVLRPGRLLSFHCMNLPTSKVRNGYIGIQDFRGMLIKMFQGDDAAELHGAASALLARADGAEGAGDTCRALRLRDTAAAMIEDLRAHPGDAGFIYHSEVVIWKDPVTAMQRTHAKGLLYKELRKDSVQSRQGIPDYLVTMLKPGANETPVTKTIESFPVERWQRYASPVWASAAEIDDEGFVRYELPNAGNPDKRGIAPGDTLQYRSVREDKDEKHICPLQLDVIRRAVKLWTNPGEVVLTPFGGIGSEGVVAIEEGRHAVLVELKASYFAQMIRNLAAADPMARGKQLRLGVDLDAAPGVAIGGAL